MTSTSTVSSKPTLQQPTLLLIVFFATAVAYIALRASGFHGPWMAVAKILPILTLVVMAMGSLTGLTRGLVLAALGLSALGDVFLALEFPNQFIFGLSAFLLAQLTYAANFLRNADFRNKRSVLRGLPLLIASGLLASVLLPAAGDLAAANAFYLCAILLMALSAGAHRGDSALLFAGAVTFMVSDSLIAVNKFLTPVPMSGLWVMVTYYAAQLMLVLGIARARETA